MSNKDVELVKARADSDFKGMIAFGVLIFLICMGIGGCAYLVSKADALNHQNESK